jgi:hypothetical protein
MERLGDSRPERSLPGRRLSAVVYDLAGDRLLRPSEPHAVDRTYGARITTTSASGDARDHTRFPVAAVLAAQHGLADPVPDRSALMPQAYAHRPEPTLANSDPRMTFGEFVDQYGEAVTDLYQRRRAGSPPMVWTVSYRYLTPSPAGPTRDGPSGAPPSPRGHITAFGKAYVTSVGRARRRRQGGKEDLYDAAARCGEPPNRRVAPELVAPAPAPPASQQLTTQTAPRAAPTPTAPRR